MPIATLPAFKHDGSVNIVVESPRGSTIKLKHDAELDVFTLSRPLIDGLVFPFDWGFVPATRGPDGDPIDAFVMWDRSSYPGAVIACRLIGVLGVEQNSRATPGTRERNDRVVAVPVKAPRLSGLADVSDIDTRARQEIESFLIAATAFEEKALRFTGWSGSSHAYDLVKTSSRT
jgi:inorganic pyrophosphatase